MKKICIFTQTYGNNRGELYKYHNLDYYDIYFRNNFDNVYCFHNSTKDFINEIVLYPYFKKIQNIDYIEYNLITYTESFKNTLIWLKNNNYDYLIFLQDDCFLINNDNLDELITFIKHNDFDMLNLEMTPKDIKIEPSVLYKNNDFKVYNTNSNDFKNRGWFAFDDGAYVANIEFLLKEIYDDTYFGKNDIWEAENYLNQKISNKLIQRLTTNVNFYNRINIIGHNNWDRINNLEILKNKFENEN